MSDRRTKWNERYSAADGPRVLVPSAPLPDMVRRVAAGEALDLACGAGRHSIFLAQHGWRVVAVDWAERGLAALRDEADRRGIGDRIVTVAADLEATPRGYAIPPRGFDLILDFYFLDRTLLPEIRDGIKPGGHFCAAIHVDGAGVSDSANKAFVLQPGELRSVVEEWGWTVVHGFEGTDANSTRGGPTAQLIARKPDSTP